MNFKSTLKPHQEAVMEKLIESHYMICGDEQGLGKTVEALALLCEVKPTSTLILVPAFLKVNWECEILKHTDITDITVCRTGAQNLQAFKNPTKIVIASYASTKELEYAKNFDMVIIDECQAFKNMDAKRTKAFHNYIRKERPERLLMLSGTPIKNGVTEFYSLIKLCSYNVLSTSGKDIAKVFSNIHKFSEHFCYKSSFKMRGRTITNYYGLKNKDHLKALLKGKYFRRTAKQVLTLPPLTRKDVMISNKVNTELDELFEEANKVDMVSTAFATKKKDSSIAKADFTAEYCKHLLDSGCGPLVIFSCHPNAVQTIYRALSEKSRVQFIDGSVSPDKRADYVQQFQNGQLDALVATIGSASTGFTLTKSNNLIFNDLDFVPANNSQALKRVHRISQEKKTTIHYILGGPVDKKICDILIKKEEVLKEVL